MSLLLQVREAVGNPSEIAHIGIIDTKVTILLRTYSDAVVERIKQQLTKKSINSADVVFKGVKAPFSAEAPATGLSENTPPPPARKPSAAADFDSTSFDGMLKQWNEGDSTKEECEH